MTGQQTKFKTWLVVFRILAILALVAAIVATAMRIYCDYHPPGKFDPENQGLVDFHNGIYFPSKAFLNKDNPYGEKWVEKYPAHGQIPPYSPITLIIHSPLALMPLHVAEVSYFLLQLCEIGLIGLLVVWFAKPESGSKRADWLKENWFAMLCVCLLVVYSRSGHVTVFDGYFTLELVIGVLLALQFGKTKPGWGALGLTIASCKPTYAIPLAILMACRGHFKAVTIGFIASVVFAVAGFFWLSLGSSPTQVINEFLNANESFRLDPNEMPVNSWIRLDSVAIIAKWINWNPTPRESLIAMIPILVIPCSIISYLSFNSRRRDDQINKQVDIDLHGACGITGTICALTFLISIYHHFYDALVLVAPIGGIILHQLCSWKRIPTHHRIGLAICLLFPLFNYSSTDTFISHTDLSGTSLKVVTSINGVLLLLATVYACWLSLHFKNPPRDKTD